MEIEPKQVIYSKTDDPNIVIRYRLDVSEIYLDKLDQRIEILEKRKLDVGDNGDKWYTDKINQLKNIREDLTKLDARPL